MIYAYYAISISILFLIYAMMKYRKSSNKMMVSTLLIVALLSHWSYGAFLEQIAVKKYGGTLKIAMPQDMQFFSITWKDTDMWIGSFSPSTNRCVFREDSKFGILQGEVVINNCNPLGGSDSASYKFNKQVK